MIAAGLLVIAAGLFVGGAWMLGVVLGWSASGCYPWRRCGRCGR